jgi:hypothetical protein
VKKRQKKHLDFEIDSLTNSIVNTFTGDSFETDTDNVFMHLVESAPFNIGQNKIYEGVPGNLVAFACKTSFKNGLQGFVSFFSKTNLIDHYVKTLGAYHFGGHLMVISTDPAQILVDKYFKE